MTCAGAITVSQWQMFSNCRMHVAREIKPSQLGQSRIRNALGFHFQVLRTLCKKYRARVGNVFRRSRRAGKRKRITFRRWNKSSRNALPHPLFQILVRGRNHPHIALERMVSAYSIELTIAEHPQQTRLCKSNGISPISSRNKVPPSACSKRPDAWSERQ